MLIPGLTANCNSG